jgi:2-polyprenyl-3-methyl-5-hydroxy-6-metoxy-1,4-benzoquinol methylase
MSAPAPVIAPSPPPTPPRFWDRHPAAYARKPVPDPRAYEQTLHRVRAHLSPNDVVLEIGCGTGTTALKLATGVREILATDYSANMIAIATAKARAEGTTNVLRRVRELLRPGGLFISKTPCVGDQGLFLRIVIALMRAVGVAPYVHGTISDHRVPLLCSWTTETENFR